jgi:predicted ArsR family transcriptional regulator
MNTQGETNGELARQLKRANRWHTQEKIALLEALSARFGSGVLDVVDQVIEERARRFGMIIAQREGASSVDDLIRILWEPERAQGLEYTAERLPDGVQIRCTRCPMHELARDIRQTEWMHRLVCAADPYVVAGFSSKIRLRRTKTLMQGDDCCDHFYSVKA